MTPRSPVTSRFAVTSSPVRQQNQMRVLMICQRMLPYLAGAEIKAFELARSLISHGEQAAIVTTKFEKGLSSLEEMRGVRVRRLPVIRHAATNGATGRASTSALKTTQFLSAFAFILARGRAFDIIHAHCLSAASLGAVAAARLIDRPVLLEPSLGGPGGEFERILDSPLARPMLNVLKSADCFSANSPTIGDQLVELGIDPARIFSVKNGVDLESFRPAQPGERDLLRRELGLPGGPIALFVGQLIERKGISVLLSAWRLVAESLQDASLLIVGDTGVAREAVGRNENLEVRIRFLGVRRDVPQLMRAADLLVLPSRNESFGNVFIEALATGLPVVASRTGILQTLEIDGVAGRIVDPDDPADIASAIVRILGSPDRGASLGSRGPGLVEQFSFTRVAEEYRDIYRKVIQFRS